MEFSRAWLEMLVVLCRYAEVRRRKGLLSGDFLLRGMHFIAARSVGSRRTQRRSPLIATLSITSKCPLNCYHCSEGYRGGYQLPVDIICRTLDELVGLGCPSIAFSGGEPFSRPELVSFLDRIPASTTTLIFTSGIGLTAELADTLIGRRNLLPCFSLDHLDPREHDRRRGYPGAHQAVMRGIERLRRGRAEIHVSSLVTRDRLESGELEEFIRWLRSHGVACVQLFQPRPVGRLTGQREVCLRPEEEDRVSEVARALNEDPQAPLVVAYPAVEDPEMLGCCGGYARVHIDSLGHVCPCDFAPLSFGRITKEPFVEIWKRMRSFFAAPSDRCLVRDNPGIFEGEREERNVMFSDLADPERLRGSPPGVYRRLGERAYRLLASGLTLASVAADYWGGGKK